MNKETLSQALAHAQQYNSIRLLCTESWNGFIAGASYEAFPSMHNLRTVLAAHDKHSIITPITESAAAFFEIDNGVQMDPVLSEEERRQQERQAIANKLCELGDFLLRERPQFHPRELLEWIPVMNNRRLPSAGAVMMVIEQLPVPTPVCSGGNLANPNDNELVDLRVACLATSSRDDEDCLVEVMVDSRRVRRWGSA